MTAKKLTPAKVRRKREALWRRERALIKDGIALREACPHENIREFSGLRRCSDCHEEWFDTDGED